MHSMVGSNEGTKLPLDELRGKPSFKIAHLNIRSLVHKINQLRIDLPCSQLDVLTISETWLNKDTEDRLASVSGYSLTRLDRKTRRPDGLTKTGGEGTGHICQDQYRYRFHIP